MNLGVKSRWEPLEMLLEANIPATSVSLTSLRLARLFIEGAIVGFYSAGWRGLTFTYFDNPPNRGEEHKEVITFKIRVDNNNAQPRTSEPISIVFVKTLGVVW